MRPVICFFLIVLLGCNTPDQSIKVINKASTQEYRIGTKPLYEAGQHVKFAQGKNEQFECIGEILDPFVNNDDQGRPYWSYTVLIGDRDGAHQYHALSESRLTLVSDEEPLTSYFEAINQAEPGKPIVTQIWTPWFAEGEIVWHQRFDKAVRIIDLDLVGPYKDKNGNVQYFWEAEYIFGSDLSSAHSERTTINEFKQSPIAEVKFYADKREAMKQQQLRGGEISFDTSVNIAGIYYDLNIPARNLKEIIQDQGSVKIAGRTLFSSARHWWIDTATGATVLLPTPQDVIVSTMNLEEIKDGVIVGDFLESNGIERFNLSNSGFVGKRQDADIINEVGD